MKILYHPKRILGFESFISPVGFDRKIQALDIYDVLERYYKNHRTARYIYSFTSAIATLTLSAVGGISYRWGETISGVNYVYDVNSGTAFTSGSTKRYVIVKNTASSFSINLPAGSTWLYIGSCTVNTLNYGNISYRRDESYLQYIHASDIDVIKGFTGYAFWGCLGLEGKITFPNINLSFGGDRCFSYCPKITGTVTITKNMKSVGSWCFQGTPITQLIFEDGTDLEVIGHMAFSGCPILAPDFTKATKLYDIRYGAFSGCTTMTGTLVFPESLTTIGYDAFNNTQYSGNLNIVKNTTSIGYSAFTYNLFTSITVDALNTNFISDDAGGDTDVLYDISVAGKIKANHSARGNVGTLVLRSDTTDILTRCSASNSLKTGTLVIPSTVTIIGDAAFSSCSSLSGNLSIPDSVLTIGGNSFSYMNMNGTLTFGSGVTTIGNECFRNGKWTGDLSLPDSLINIGSFAFWLVPFGGTLTLGSYLTTITTAVFGGCVFTGDFVIPASLTTLDANTSYRNFNSVNFTTITSSSTIYPASDNVLYDLKTSGKVIAFINAKSYNGTLTLRSDTTELYLTVFSNSLRTGTINIPATVTIIGQQSFENVVGITALAFSGTPTIATIALNAFYNCKALTGTLTLPASLGTAANSIAANAFSGSSEANRPQFTRCDSLKSTPPNAATNAFAFRDAANESVAIPLHILATATGYTVAPWTNTAIFSSVTADL